MSPGVSRPTNNAGGLEGGVTNGEDLRVSAWMKPISTLMKPLRSVDLTTMTESPAAIERSDVCAVPAAAVVGEAMVALVLADALLENFGGDSIAELERALAAVDATAVRDRVPAADDPTDPAIRRPSAARAAADVDDLRRRPPAAHRRHDRDDVRRARRRAGGDAGRRAAARCSSSICPSAAIRRDLIVMINPAVRRARRHAARRRRLPQRARLQRDGRPARARGRQGARSARRRNRRSRARGLLARAFQHEMDHLDGMVFVDRLRGIKRDLIVRKIQKLKRTGKW